MGEIFEIKGMKYVIHREGKGFKVTEDQSLEPGDTMYVMMPVEEFRGLEKKLQSQREVNDRLYRKLYKSESDSLDPEEPVLANVNKKGSYTMIAQLHFPLPEVVPDPTMYQEALDAAIASWRNFKRVHFHQQYGWLVVVEELIRPTSQQVQAFPR